MSKPFEPTACGTPRAATGFTLIELIVVIVVLAGGLAGILSVFNQTVLRSADPVLQQQALAVGEGYMEEIVGMRCPGESPAGTSRGEWEFVRDYDAIDDESPKNVDGGDIDALSDYRVSVDVDEPHPLDGVAGCRITVTVTAPGDTRAELQAFRAHD